MSLKRNSGLWIFFKWFSKPLSPKLIVFHAKMVNKFWKVENRLSIDISYFWGVHRQARDSHCCYKTLVKWILHNYGPFKSYLLLQDNLNPPKSNDAAVGIRGRRYCAVISHDVDVFLVNNAAQTVNQSSPKRRQSLTSEPRSSDVCVCVWLSFMNGQTWIC